MSPYLGPYLSLTLWKPITPVNLMLILIQKYQNVHSPIVKTSAHTVLSFTNAMTESFCFLTAKNQVFKQENFLKCHFYKMHKINILKPETSLSLSNKSTDYCDWAVNLHLPFIKWLYSYPLSYVSVISEFENLKTQHIAHNQYHLGIRNFIFYKISLFSL